MWNSVDTRLPDYDENVLLWSSTQKVVIGYRAMTDRRGEHWRGPYRIGTDSCDVTDVTYWAVLPDMPSHYEGNIRE